MMSNERMRFGVLVMVVLFGGAVLLPASPQLLGEAADALKSGSEIRAWELVSQVPSATPKALLAASPDLAVWVADQYRMQRRFDDSIAICSQIANAGDAVSPALRAQAMLVKGNVYATQQNFVAARLEYRSLTENDTYRQTDAGRQARFLILDVMRRTGDHEGALAMIERLRDLPDSETRAYALYQRAHIAFDQNDLQETREFIDLAKAEKPDLIENLFLEARLNLQQDRLQDPELEIGARVLSTYVIPGRPVSLRMHDRNLAIARGEAGIPIEVTTAPGNDRETVTLLASPRDATLFRAVIPTLLGAAVPGNNRLEVKGGDIVSYRILEEFQRQNDLSYDAKQMVVVSDAELTASSGEWVTASERDQEMLQRQLQARLEAEGKGDTRAFERVRDTRVVRPGNPVYMQVIDYDRSVSDAPDSVFVSATATSGGHIEGVQLTETEPHSGVFRGLLKTTPALPQASASDTAATHRATAPLFAKDDGTWSSAPDGKQGKWYALDLMAMQPLKEVVLDLEADTVLKNVSLFDGSGRDAVEIASTHPSPRVQYGYVDLAAHFSSQRPTQTAGYLYAEIDGGAGGPAVFKIGSCDGVVVWLNGERVHNNQGGRIWKPEEDVVTVTLRPGVNSIMLRVSQLTGPWGASLTVTDAQGTGLASLRPPAPARPGVVTGWYLFNRLTPENIRVAERVSLEQPVRIRDEVFRWIPLDVTPAAAMTVDGNSLRITFNDSIGRRNLRWVFNEFSGTAVKVRQVSAVNRFDDKVLPVDATVSQATGSERTLELGPGDTVQIAYNDERRVRDDEMIVATMKASFHNATIGFFYDLISQDRSGERVVTYDRAFRYVPGETERLAIRVEDYDADVSRDPDRIRLLIENSKGDKFWMEAVETGNHTGVFVGILRLGPATGEGVIAAVPGGWLRVSYADRENTDGIIARTSSVASVTDVAPDLHLVQCAVEQSTAPAVQEGAAAPLPAKVTRTRFTEATRQDAPLVTSLEANLEFEVIWPTVALRSGSQIPAELSIQRVGQAPVTVMMGLGDPVSGTFSASVPQRVGMAAAYTDLDAGDPDATPPLYVLGGDLVRVALKAADGKPLAEGWYRLASDASLRFTDRNYEGAAGSLHVGDYVYVIVRDPDQDRSDALDTVSVQLEGSGRSQALVLTETLPHSGVFTGRIRTRAPGAVTPAVADAVEGAAVPEAAEPTLEVGFGSVIKATYVNQTGVLQAAGTPVVASLGVYRGDDGRVAGFSKRFADEDIAVRTRLLTAEALFEMAKEYRVNKQDDMVAEALAEGRTILQEAIIDYPHTKHAPHAEYLLANLAQELEDYQGALVRYNRVLSAWPDSDFAPKSQLKKGIVLEASGDPDNAMDAYVELTYSYPGSELVSDAVVRIGQHFYRIERFDLSGRVFSQFHVRNPENPLAPRVLFLAAQSFMKGAENAAAKAGQGRSDPKTGEFQALAVSHFETLIEAYGDQALVSESLYWLGDVSLKQGNLRGAYMAFRRLTFDYPESRWARFARGRLAENADAFSRVAE